MHQVQPTTFWYLLGMAATAMAGLLTMQLSHASDGVHRASASQSEVSDVKVRLERLATEVEHHSVMLGELREDIKGLQQEQSDSSREILEAIRGR